jgi:hypothetical protein
MYYLYRPIDTFTSLPQSGNLVGDNYVTLDTRILYIWNGSDWQDNGIVEEGVSGTFTAGGKTITVVDGIITSIL